MRTPWLLLLAGCAAAPTAPPPPPGVLAGRVAWARTGAPLANAFVRVVSGPLPKSAPPTDPVHLDQVSFEFVPRVFGIRVGQPLRITSQDASAHNVNAQPFENRPFNENLFGGDEKIHRFTAVEVPILLQCHVHPQMKAWACVVDNPYFAVTGADGAFEIRGLPPGGYAVEAWHEDFGSAKGETLLTATAGARWEVGLK